MLDYGPQLNQYIIKNAPQQLQQYLQPHIAAPSTQTVGYQTPKLPQTQRFLDKLQEEASEVIQAVSKIRRFGPDNHHPDRTLTNKQELIGELEDFLALIAVLEASEYFDLSKSRDSIKTKAEELLK
jgi:NTP pyrophosphatase (non-canonical NTP hydrolase)